jgi:hypothetical protein
MELVEGEDLSERIGGAIPDEAIATAIVGAAGRARSRHRDLKPALSR